MIESIPVDIIEGWLTDLQSILKQESQEAKTQPDFLINKGMRHGIAQIEGKLITWLRHKENKDRLTRSGKKFLITKDVVLSDGRYRKLEWYEGDRFIVLAWRHGMREETGELLLEVQQVPDLSKTFLVYVGRLSYDERTIRQRQGLFLFLDEMRVHDLCDSLCGISDVAGHLGGSREFRVEFLMLQFQ